LNEERKQWAEAGHAWLAASQSAPDAEHRDQYLAERTKIEQLRLDDEEEQRRKEAAAKAAETERLKAEARQEIARIEARANSRPVDNSAPTVDWADINPDPVKLTGTLIRVECTGNQKFLSVKAADGKVTRLALPEAAGAALKGEPALACGSSRQRPLAVTYQPSADSKKAISGEVTEIELR
jgi:hypothetical protein